LAAAAQSAKSEGGALLLPIIAVVAMPVRPPHVHDGLGQITFVAVEMDPQEVYAGMVDAAGLLQDLTKDMLEAGLAKDEDIGDAQD
jgi:hypothetical protein